MTAPGDYGMNDFLSQYLAKPDHAILAESELDSSTEFTIHRPFLSRAAINAGIKLFSHQESKKKSCLSLEKVRNLLPAIFAEDRQLPPKSEVVDAILRKLKFGRDRMIKKFEFRRFLKDLAGYKNYDSQSISTPKPDRQTNIRINFNQLTSKLQSMPDLGNPIFAINSKNSALSSDAVIKAKDVFDKLDSSHADSLQINALEAHIKVIFEADNSPVPSENDIIDLYQAFHYTPEQKISLSLFVQFLQQLKSNMVSNHNIQINPDSTPITLSTKGLVANYQDKVSKSISVSIMTKENEKKNSNHLLSDDQSQKTNIAKKPFQIKNWLVLWFVF